MFPLDPLSSDQTRAALRALAAVARADGAIDPRERALVALEGVLLDADLDVDALEPIGPAELAAALPPGVARRAVVQRMVMLTLMDERIAPEELAAVRAFASALGVDEPAVRQLELRARDAIGRLGLDLLRHGFVGRKLASWVRERGLGGLATLARTAAGGDPATTARWNALADLPEETFGRGLWEHFRRNGFPPPGTPGSAEPLLFHDVGHVLSGHATDPVGEVRMAGFEAGYMGEDGFGVVTLALLLFHLGTELPNTQPARGAFDLTAFHEALALGRRVRRDLRDWPWEAHVARPLAEVRVELGLPAR